MNLMNYYSRRPRMPGKLSDRHVVKVLLRNAGLSTVCEEARCPNISDCFRAKTATFLILGDVCTRGCNFCAIPKSKTPKLPDSGEPQRVAKAVSDLNLSHVVITSVTRDDLKDGGAQAFADCIKEIRTTCPATTVEVLVPDFAGNPTALAKVLSESPAVLNHNLETVPRLYPTVRPGASFSRSLEIIRQAASCNLIVKSGLMAGLGESYQEIMDVLASLAQAGCRVVTVGQYLQPTYYSLPVAKIYSQDEFDRIAGQGEKMGLLVVAGPLVRSSFKAGEVLEKLMLKNKSDFDTDI